MTVRFVGEIAEVRQCGPAHLTCQQRSSPPLGAALRADELTGGPGGALVVSITTPPLNICNSKMPPGTDSSPGSPEAL